MPALLAGPEMQAADCKRRFAGTLLDSRRALILRRPSEGDFESVRVLDPSYHIGLKHFFHGRQNKGENCRQRTEWAVASGYAAIASGHRIAKREFRD